MQLSFINADQFFAAPRIFAKAIISDSVKPGRETRFAAKSADVFVGANEGFLREIIGQREVCSGKLAQQTSHTRLVPTDQLAKSVLVIIDKNSGDEVRISELHVPMLLRRGRRWNVLLSLQFPHEQITGADQERDDAEAPGSAFPIIDRSEKEHEPQPDHDEDNSSTHI